MGFSFNFVRFFLILPVRLSLGFSLFSFLIFVSLISFVCVCDVKYSAHCAASPGGTGHLRTRARVSQRITNSVELLPTTPAIQ